MFEDLPDISSEAIDCAKKYFSTFLFMETLGRGQKRFVCSACGESFIRGKSVILRTETEADAKLDRAKHKEEHSCPYCRQGSEVVNVKLCNPKRKNEEKFFVIFQPVTPEKVYARCVRIDRWYHDSLSGTWRIYELMRYVLEPGKAEMYEANYGGAFFCKNSRFRDAFVWNRGFYTEKYAYSAIYCDFDGSVRYVNARKQEEALDGTFLKYNSFFYYEGPHGYNLPYVKYLCWYAIHPQIELLAKSKRFGVIDEMIIGNTDDRSYFDWSAKTPWGLYRMDKQLFEKFEKHAKFTKSGDSIRLFKTFRDIKGKTEKDIEFADKINSMTYQKKWGNYGPSGGRSEMKKFLSLCRKLRIAPKAAYEYIEKFRQANAYGCHHCPGITIAQAYEQWSDYVLMAIAKEESDAGKKPKVYALNPFPKDLISAHNSLVGMRERLQNAKSREEYEALAKKIDSELTERSDKYALQFPGVMKRLSEIRQIYEYSESELSIVVPNSIKDILREGEVLHHCIGREGTAERYLGRIESNESYLLFLRKTGAINKSFYTLEVEPDGTVRQKRTVNDRQDEDIVLAMPFIERWQAEVSGRLTEKEHELTARARQARKAEHDQLRKNGIRIHYGELSGKLLADVLDNDLIINRSTAQII